MTDRPAPHLAWQSATIVDVIEQTPRIRSFFLRLSVPFAHVAGQHVDVRLTAPNGYVAMRSYSIASTAGSVPMIELAIERLPTGEVSPYFHDVAREGDAIELRGPIGGHFLWPCNTDKPVLLIGAGSGVVPLMAMLRYRHTQGQIVPTALLLSSRTREDVPFREPGEYPASVPSALIKETPCRRSSRMPQRRPIPALTKACRSSWTSSSPRSS